MRRVSQSQPFYKTSIQRAADRPSPSPRRVDGRVEVAAPGLLVVEVLALAVLVEEVPLMRSALARYASKLFGPLSTALTLKTMPAPQCETGLVCLQ